MTLFVRKKERGVISNARAASHEEIERNRGFRSKTTLSPLTSNITRTPTNQWFKHLRQQATWSLHRSESTNILVSLDVILCQVRSSPTCDYLLASCHDRRPSHHIHHDVLMCQVYPAITHSCARTSTQDKPIHLKDRMVVYLTIEQGLAQV